MIPIFKSLPYRCFISKGINLLRSQSVCAPQNQNICLLSTKSFYCNNTITNKNNYSLPPASQSILNAILDKPECNKNIKIDISPLLPFQIEKVDKWNEVKNVQIEEPISNNQNIDKHAIVMILIRRKKMKKHKLRKLRIRMKFEWAKVRQRREMRKEKAFQLEMSTKIKEGDRFDAEKYVQDKLHLLHLEKPPSFGKGAPDWYIQERLDLQEKIRKEREGKKMRRRNLHSDYVKDWVM